MIYDLLEIIPFAFRLYNNNYDAAILYYHESNECPCLSGLGTIPPCGKV
jgi:hypothetical protein